MSNYKKLIASLVLTTIILASTMLAACAEGTISEESQTPATPEGTTVTTATTLATKSATATSQPASASPATLSEQEARQLLKDARQNIVNARKYRIQGVLSMNVRTGSSFISPTITATADGAFDKVKNQSFLDIMMAVDIGRSLGKLAINIDIFSMTDYIYVKIDMGSQSLPWVKTRPTAELLDNLNADMFEKDFNSMDSPAEVTYLVDENINGTDYRVIQYVPSPEYLRESISDSAGDISEIEWAKITDIRSIIKKLSYKVWIAKNTRNLQKMEYAASFSLTKDVFVNPKEAEDIYCDLSGSFSIQDLNVEFSVNLPTEAQNARGVLPEDVMIT